MKFSLTTKEEAKNFCFGSAMSIGSQRSDPSFQQYLDQLISNAKNDPKLRAISFQDLATLTARLTRDRVIKDGDKANDLNSVGWHMGILCSVWRNSLPVCNQKYDDIFIESWMKYFESEV